MLAFLVCSQSSKSAGLRSARPAPVAKKIVPFLINFKPSNVRCSATIAKSNLETRKSSYLNIRTEARRSPLGCGSSTLRSPARRREYTTAEAVQHASSKAVLDQPPDPLFTAVGRKKLLVMSIGTLGLYTIYWDYLNWRLIENRTQGDSSTRPLFRAATSPFLSFRLFNRIVNTYQNFALSSKVPISPVLLSVITTGCWMFPFIPTGSAPFWILIIGDIACATLLSLPRLIMQEYAHKINQHVAEETNTEYIVDDHISAGSWLLILFIGLLNLYGYFLLYEDRKKVNTAVTSTSTASSSTTSSSNNSSPMSTSPHVNLIAAKWPLKQFQLPAVGTQPGNGSPPPTSPPSSPAATPPASPRGPRNSS